MKRQITRLPPRPAGRDRYIVEQPTPDDAPSSATSRAGTVVIHAAKSIAGSFIACFVPPEFDLVSENSVASHHTKHGSVGLRTPASGSSHGFRNGSRHSYSPQAREDDCDGPFTIEQICRATMNFSPSLKIGEGGFGTVYKGTLDNGTPVAIKRAKKETFDDQMGMEFKREIEMLTQVKHFGLVKLLGFLEEGDEKILVVEYVSNGSLREHLDGKRGDYLNFSVRLDIARDVAHAIAYLHTYTDHPIIHRDIKSSNILLTDSYRAKVTDFGFARLAADRDSGFTHVSTVVKGTAGYLDPQYMKTRQLTEKCDVYSFGVLLVELFSGRRPIESKRVQKERVTATWAVKKLISGDAISVLDPELERNDANTWALEKILQLALQCLVSQRDTRPSMRTCADILLSIRKNYKELSAISHSRNSSMIEE